MRKLNRHTRLRTAVKTLFGVTILLALLFIPAGTIFWLEAWLFVFLYLGYVIFLYLWLRNNDPELLKERSSRQREGKTWDKVILSVYTALLVLMLVSFGLDAVRFKWSNPPGWLKIAGFIGLIPAGLLVFLTIRENTFLSKVVRIQKDRSHKVIRSGPYRFIRHPMYAAIILMMLFLPVALGSYLGYVFSIPVQALFFIRTRMEDLTLRKELPGYQAYARKVRYRLIPGIW